MNYIDEFIQDCRLRGLTAHTIETYRSNLKTFLETFPDPVVIGQDELRAHLDTLRSRGLQAGTLRGHFYALGAFYSYLEYEHRIKINPMNGFRRRYLNRAKLQHEGDHTRQLISVQDMQLLISAAPGIREKALLMTLAKTGMRRGELLDLRPRDINLKQSLIYVPPKAKRTYCTAFIDEELAAVLHEYLAWRKPRARSDWLWISNHGGRIHKDYVGKVLASLGEELGLHDPRGPLSRRLTPHCCRHWFVTHLFRAGMRIEYLKWLRGDALQKEAWQLYNHIDAEEVRQEYLRCIPKLISFDRKISEYYGAHSSTMSAGQERR